ncbi:MAG TPA: DUF58 domain-containing protein, partial [Nitriliruptorales bacterium]
LTLAAAWVLGRRRIELEADRSDVPSRVREGQVVDVTLRLTARHRATTLIVHDRLHPYLGRTVPLPLPSLRAGETADHTYRLRPALRGIYQIGPLVAEWTDPFGLTRHRRELADATPVIVHPSTEPVHDRVISRAWEDPPIRPPVSKPWPTGYEFYGMRDYAYGDDPRRIIWRASARATDPRTGLPRYLVRESEQGISDQVHLVLDTGREVHDRGPVSPSFELLVRVAGSLGTRHLGDGFSVSLDANDGPLTAPLRGRRSRIPLLDVLAGVQRGDAGLSDAIDRLVARRDARTHHVVITPHVSSDAARGIRLLLERGTSMLLVLYVTEDSDPVSLHRAGALGCGVVELQPGTPMEKVFRQVIRAVGA